MIAFCVNTKLKKVITVEVLAALQIGGDAPISKEELREELRASLSDQLGGPVWFGDEVVSGRDPVAGPCPKYGPKAEAMLN